MELTFAEIVDKFDEIGDELIQFVIAGINGDLIGIRTTDEVSDANDACNGDVAGRGGVENWTIVDVRVTFIHAVRGTFHECNAVALSNHLINNCGGRLFIVVANYK